MENGLLEGYDFHPAHHKKLMEFVMPFLAFNFHFKIALDICEFSKKN